MKSGNEEDYFPEKSNIFSFLTGESRVQNGGQTLNGRDETHFHKIN